MRSVRIDRRTFLKGTGSLALVATAPFTLAVAEAAPAAVALAPARRRTYAALVEALAGSPHAGHVDGARAHVVASKLAERYPSEPATVRLNVDAMLDAVDAAAGAIDFATLPVPERLRVLRAELHQPHSRDGRDDDLPGRGFLVSQAVALASAPFEEPELTRGSAFARL